MADSRKLQVEIIGDSRSLERAFGRSSHASSGFSNALRNVGKVAALAAVGGIAAVAVGLKKSFDAAADAEVSQKKLAAQLSAVGISYKAHAKVIEDTLQKHSMLSAFDDEDLSDSFSSLVRSTGSVNDAFKEQQIVMDVARGKGIDLTAATQLVTKAHMGQIGALRRVGIDIKAVTTAQDALGKGASDAAKAQAKATDLAATKQAALGLLQQKFAGQAEAYGKTATGAQERLGVAFENLEEVIGSKLLPIFTPLINRLADFVVKVTESERLAEILSRIGDAAAGIGEKFQQGFQIAIDVFDMLKGPLADIGGKLERNKDVVLAVTVAFGTMAVAIIAVQKALAVATTLQLAFNLAVESNPYVLAASAVLALGAALGVLYVRNQRVHEAIDKLYADIKTIAIPTLRVLERAWEMFGAAITAIVKAFAKTVTIPFQNAYDAIVGGFRAFRALFTGDWRALGQALLQIIDALGGNLVKAVLAQVGAVFAAAKALGQAIIDGILAGLTGLLSRVGGAIASSVHGAIGWARAHVGSTAEEHAAKMLGVPMGEGIILGWILGTRDLPAKMSDSLSNAIDAAAKAVAAKAGAFEAAFSSLTNAALAVFDRLAEGVKTKAEKALAAFDLKQAVAEAKKRIKELQDAVTEAQVALQAHAATGIEQVKPKEGETAEELAARQAAALKTFNDEQLALAQQYGDAQQALEDEQSAQALAKQRAALEAKAAKERQEMDDENQRRRDHFANRLGQLQANLESHRISYAQFTERLKALFAANEIPFKKAARGLGKALQDGLEDAWVGVDRAAKALADIIVDRLSKITVKVQVELQDVTLNPEKDPTKRARGGPVRRGSPYVVGESGPELFVPNSAGRIVANGSSGGMGAGDVYVTVNAPNYVGTNAQLAAVVRDSLLEMKRRGVNLGFA